MFSFSGTRIDGDWRRLLISYAPDWVISIGLLAIFGALELVPGYKRHFSLDDKTYSIQFPFTVHERVPDAALFLICFVAPFCLLPVINYLTVRSKWDWHVSALGLLFAVSLTSVVTVATKITVGRPRPDLISRCMPEPGSIDPPLGLSTSAICTQTNHFIFNDGWRSFPSGHSSLSFAGLGFLSLYIAGKLHLFNREGRTAKIWISLIPLLGATLVAVSRTMDYRHHWQDVIAGSALGMTLAYLSYRQYYPSLQSDSCHEAHPPRIKFESILLPTHNLHIRNHEMHGPQEQYDGSNLPYRDEDEDVEQELLTSHNSASQNVASVRHG